MLERYQRQMIFADLGEDGQRRLLDATVVLVGCGATGTALANLLARTGVGRLRIIDRDFVELTNLQRQTLFDEADITNHIPKAEAAAHRLRQINSEIEIEGIVADFNPGNALALLQDATIVLDGTDNFQTRYLINDACLKLGKPWVYTGVVATYGMTTTMIPDKAVAGLPSQDGASGDSPSAEQRKATGCLRCLIGEAPPPGTGATCDTVGVIGPAVALITAISAGEAVKLIVGKGKLNPGIMHVDVWTHEYEMLAAMPRNPNCIACGQHQYSFLNAEQSTTSTVLCGRNAVQVSVNNGQALNLEKLESQLAAVVTTQKRNPYLLRAQIDDYELTIFPDNRAIIKGTEDESLAKSLYSRYIGN